MKKPTMVTIADSERVIVEVSRDGDAEVLRNLGFAVSENHHDVFGFRSSNAALVYAMIEKLRDLGIPFSTHRTGGADYFVETYKAKGLVSGSFKRINFFGNDFGENAPWKIEEF
jgi:hypothetical protein